MCLQRDQATGEAATEGSPRFRFLSELPVWLWTLVLRSVKPSLAGL